MPRGADCGLHPAKVMGKKRSPCGRTDKAVEVEDHGNGFMFIGTIDVNQCRRLLAEYVDDPEAYISVAPVLHRYDDGRVAHGRFLSPDFGALWDGATDALGKPTRGVLYD